MTPHPENNVTAGEMLRRLQEFIFTNPDGEATDNAAAVFTRLMTQVIGLVESNCRRVAEHGWGSQRVHEMITERAAHR